MTDQELVRNETLEINGKLDAISEAASTAIEKKADELGIDLGQDWKLSLECLIIGDLQDTVTFPFIDPAGGYHESGESDPLAQYE